MDKIFKSKDGRILHQSGVTGTIRPLEVVEAVDAVFNKTKSSDIWVGIDKIIERWQLNFPNEYKEIELMNSVNRLNMADKQKGRAKEHGFLRYKLEIPERVASGIDLFYGHIIPRSPGGWKAFDEEFGQRYPIFRMAAR